MDANVSCDCLKGELELAGLKGDSFMMCCSETKWGQYMQQEAAVIECAANNFTLGDADQL